MTVAMAGRGWRQHLAGIPEIQERCGSTAEAVTKVFQCYAALTFLSTSIPGHRSHAGERRFLPSQSATVAFK